MTNFNPEGGFKDIETWESIAEKKAGNTGAASKFIGGILIGGLGVSMGAEILGGVVAAWLFKSAWDALSNAGTRLKLVRDMGCNSFVLGGSDFKTYVQQFGDKAVHEELIHAQSQECELSNDAANWLHNYTKTNCRFNELSPIQEVKVLDKVTATALESTLDNLPKLSIKDRIANVFNPLANSEIDIIPEMSNRIGNTIVIGVPGSGKGILISNAIREAKYKHPDLKVFVIDPKADAKEKGYFDCCDVVNQYFTKQNPKPTSIMDINPGAVAEWAEAAFKQYAEWAQSNSRTLLIVDEGTMLGNKLQQAKCTLLVDKLTAYTSGGDSEGRNVWFLMQSPYVGSASLNLSTSSQMTSIVIAFSENIGALIQWKLAKIFQSLSLDLVTDLIAASQIGRAVYYGKTGKWYSLPELKNYSGYNRDKREYLPGFEPVDEKINQPENSFTSEPETEEVNPIDAEPGGFDFNKALEILRTFKGKDWVKFGDARANSKPLRKVTRDADDVRLVVSFLKKDGEAEIKDSDLFLIN